MQDFRILKFLDRFRKLFQKAGIEYELMRKILQLKLIMDGRRIPTMYQNSKKPKKEGNYFLKSLWIYAIMGLIMIPFVVMGDNYIFQMSIVITVIMFVLMTSMIADFSTVLLDIRDKTILNTKPIKRSTISAAKTIHICIYMFYITLAIGAPSIVAGVISHGPGFLVIFLIELVLSDFLIVCLTAFFYFSILRFFDGEKLKDIINYVQIGLSVGMVIGYQVVARSFELVNFNVVFDLKWWHFFIPPMWYAAPFEVLLSGNSNPYYLIFTVLAVVVPIVVLLLYIKLMPAFEKNLQKLAEHGDNHNKHGGGWSRQFARVFCYTKVERTFFEFASRMMKKERDFKLKVYPILGFSAVFPFVFIFNLIQGESFEEIRSGSGFLSIYACLMMIPTVILMLNHSGKYKGSWIFKVAPLGDPSPIFKGTLKAFLIKLFVPLYIVLCIVYTIIFGLRVLPNLVIVFITVILYALVCSKALNKSIPFSVPMEEANEQGGLRLIPYMLLIGVFLLAHLASIYIPFGVWIYLVLLFIVTTLFWRKTMNVKWDN